MVIKLFDHSESEGDVFWAEYCQLENRRFRPLKKRDEYDPTWTWEYIWEIIFLQRVRGSDGNKKELEPIILIFKLVYWVGRSWRRENFEDEVHEKPFILFFLQSIKQLAIIALTFSMACIFCILSLIYVASYHQWDCSSTFVAWSTAYCGEWLVIFGACLAYFAVTEIPADVRTKFGFDMYEIWSGIGFFILCLRLFQVVQDFASLYESQHHENHMHCFGLHEFSVDVTQARFFLIMILSMDFVLSSIITVMPFSWPWIFYFTSIMILTTGIRLHTCESLLGYPESQIVAMRITTSAVIIIGYVSIIAIFSYGFVRSMKSTYLNSRHQTALAQDTRKMVDLLCSDVKMTVRSTLKSYDDVYRMTKNVLSLELLKENMTLGGEVLQHAIDLMLFLVKVGEGRHRVSFSERVRLQALFTAEALQYGKAVSLYTQGQENMRIHVNIPVGLVMTDAVALSALIYYGLSTVHSIYRYHQHSSKQLDMTISLEFAMVEDNKSLSMFAEQLPQGHRLCNMTIVIAKTKGETDITDMTALLPLIKALNTLMGGIVGNYNGQYEVFPDRLNASILVAMDLSRPENRLLLPTSHLTTEESDQSPNVMNAEGDASVDPAMSGLNDTYRNNNSVTEDTARVRNQVAYFLHEQCSIFSTIPAVEPLLLDVISHLSGGSMIPITLWRELNVTDMKIRAVIFVQTESAAQLLRDTGYRRLIVLCSEKLAYLDMDIIRTPLFDFVISLPATMEELLRLRRFLQHVSNDHENNSANNQHHPFRSSFDALHRQMSYFSAEVDREEDTIDHNLASPNHHHKSVSQILKSAARFVLHHKYLNNSIFQSIYSSCLLRKLFSLLSVIPIPTNLNESYAKWRFMNPGNDLYHHTAHVEYFSILTLVILLLRVICGVLPVQYFSANAVLVVLLLYRRSVYQLLEKLVSFRTLWYFCSLINVFAVVITLWNEFLRVFVELSLPVVALSDVPTENVRSMFSRFPDGGFGTSGKAAISFLISGSTYIRFNDFFPWPYSVITVLLYFVRLVFLMYIYCKRLLYGWQFVILLLLITLFVTMAMFHQHETENRMREEFLQLHRLISSRHYFDACLLVTRRVHDGLHILSQAQAATVQQLVDTVLSDNILLGKGLVQNIHVLHRQRMIIEQLSMELLGAETNVAPMLVCEDADDSRSEKCSDNNNSNNIRNKTNHDVLPAVVKLTKDDLVAQLRAVLLRPLVLSICSHFGQSLPSQSYNTNNASSMFSIPLFNNNYRNQPFQIKNNFTIAANTMLFVRIDPEIMLVRTDPVLLRSIITKLLREAYRLLEEEWCATSTRQEPVKKQQILLWVKATDTLQNNNSSSTNHTAANNSKNKGKIFPLAAKPMYRFTDVRRMDILCLHSAAGISNHRASSRKCGHYTDYDHQQQPIVLRKFPHPSAQYSASMMHPVNKYLPLFPNTNINNDSKNSTSKNFNDIMMDHNGKIEHIALFEEGSVDAHGTYQRYQRYTLPYVLTRRSQRFIQLVERFPVQLQASAELVRPISARFAPLCRTIYVQHVTAMGKSPILIGETTAAVDNAAVKSKLASNTKRGEANLPPKNNINSCDNSNNNSSSSSSSVANNNVETLLSSFVRPRFTGRCSLYCQPYGFLNTTERSALLTFMRFTQWAVIHYHPDPLPPLASYQHSECILIEYHPTPSLDDDDDDSNDDREDSEEDCGINNNTDSNDNTTADYYGNNNNNNRPILKGRRKASPSPSAEEKALFPQKYQHYSNYQEDSEFLFNSSQNNNGNGNQNNHDNHRKILQQLLEKRKEAWQAAQTKKYAYDVVELMHFLRLEGFVGIIVVLLPSDMSEEEEKQVRQAVETVNIFQEAVAADICIKLPLDTGKIAQVVQKCEQKLVELSLSVMD